MKSASSELKQKIGNGATFYQTAKMVFADGREKELGKADFYMSGNTYSDGPGANSFPIGEAMAKTITMSLVNDDDRFSEYDFYKAVITAYLKCDLSETTESILLGTFTVIEPEYYGTQVSISAIDDMYKGDKDYTTNLVYPATLLEILIDSCNTCGVSLLSTAFANSSFAVQTKPEGITHRQLWGMVAMIAGGNARMDEYNRLEIVTYDFSYFEQNNNLDGGTFSTETTPYSDGDNADGGNFTDYSSGDGYDGGTFEETNNYHYFYRIKTPTIATDDVVITGIQTEINDTTYLHGEEGYVLKVENQLIEDSPEEALQLIGGLIVGLKFRPFTIDHVAYPLAEFGDLCYVSDRKGNVYQSVVTDMNFTFFGYTTISCSADDPVRNSSKYASSKTEAVIAARKERNDALTARDIALRQLTNLMTQSFGLFKTEEKQEDRSMIYYLHNKPELANSSTIWKMTADAFAVSTDGGQTWNAGLDSEGNAVLNVLSAIGINFDWAHGGTLKLGGTDNVDGVMEVYNADGKLVCKITKDGLETNSAKITGGTVNIATSSAEHSAISLNYITESGATFSLRQSPMLLAIDQIWDENVESHITLTGQSLMLEKTIAAGPVTTILKPSFLSFSIGQDEVGSISADSNGILISGEEYGSNSNGHYHKFHDGTLICTKKEEISTTCNNAWGALYDSSVIDMGNWPMSFVDTPTIHAEFCADNSFAWPEGFKGVSATSAGQTYLCRATDTGTLITGKLHITGVGRWR